MPLYRPAWHTNLPSLSEPAKLAAVVWLVMVTARWVALAAEMWDLPLLEAPLQRTVAPPRHAWRARLRRLLARSRAPSRLMARPAAARSRRLRVRACTMRSVFGVVRGASGLCRGMAAPSGLRASSSQSCEVGGVRVVSNSLAVCLPRSGVEHCIYEGVCLLGAASILALAWVAFGHVGARPASGRC